MSLKLSLLNIFVKIIGVKRMFSVGEDGFKKNLKKFDEMPKKKLNLKIFKDNNIDIEKIEERNVYRVKRDNKRKDKVVIYNFGGGFVANPDNNSFKFINEILKRIDCEVVMPDYPLYPGNKLSEIVGFINKVYERVLEDYDNKEIIFLGFSSGASLCMYLFNYRNMKKLDPKYPRMLILSSPVGEMPPSEDTLKNMKEIDKKDAVLSYKFIYEIGKAMQEEEFPNLPSATEHDLTGFPPIKLMLGEHEIFYAYLPAYKRAEKKYDLDIEYIIGEKMPHCWPFIISTSEGRDGFEKIIDLIKDKK